MSIKIDLKILLFLLLFCITSQMDMYILLMTFACIHELAHLLVGLFLKFKPKELKLSPVGLQIEFYIKCDDYNRKIIKGNSLGIKKIIIALAGPIVNFIIIGMMMIIHKIGFGNIDSSTYQNIIYTNFLIGIFNLIPIYPLDGGRIIQEILHIIIGLKESYRWTHTISKIVLISLTAISSIAILYLKNIAILIIVIYLWILTIQQSRIYHAKEKINEMIEDSFYKTSHLSPKVKTSYKW